MARDGPPYALRAYERAGVRATRGRARRDARRHGRNTAARRARGRVEGRRDGNFLVVDVAASSSRRRRRLSDADEDAEDGVVEIATRTGARVRRHLNDAEKFEPRKTDEARAVVVASSARSAGFKDSVAGKSNWNAYEGSAEKTLSPEELRAKNAAEEKEIQARRAAAAKKMEEERKAAGM